MTTALRRIQIGKETTRGTLVAADTILRGALQFTPSKEWIAPEDQERNSLALRYDHTEVAKHTALQFSGNLTYEQVLQFLDMGVKGSVSPSTPTNGVLTRDWTYTPGLSSLNAPEAYTFEYGDDQQEYECGHVMCEQLEIAGAMGEACTLNATLFGQGEAKSTFTGALTVPSVEYVAAQDFALYVDSSWANLGNTQKSALLASFSVRLPTGIQMVRYADGSTDFSTYAENKRAAEIELTLRHNSDGEAQYDNWAAGTLIFVRLLATGSEIEQVTPTYDKQFQMDFAMRYTEPPTFFEDYNGHNTVVLRGMTYEDPTSGNDMSFFVRNTITGT